jgi:hypothetical protein
MVRPRLLALALVASVTSGCGALAGELHTAETRYDEARYDEALVWLSDLEDDLPDMDADQQARFYFLRGMTAYRTGERDEALHYLALAREVVEATDATLPPAWQTQLTSTLAELVPDTATFHARPEPSEDLDASAEPGPDASASAEPEATSSTEAGAPSEAPAP